MVGLPSPVLFVVVGFEKQEPPPAFAGGGCFVIVDKRLGVFGRPGSDLLSQALRPSTIGAKGFNGRVRDGIGFWDPCNSHRIGEKHFA